MTTEERNLTELNLDDVVSGTATDAHDAKARQIADRLLDGADGYGVDDIAAALRDCEAATWHRMRDQVEATAREVERQTLERAAKVSENHDNDYIAARIRALAQEEPKT
jgi:hypothetical protein